MLSTEQAATDATRTLLRSVRYSQVGGVSPVHRRTHLRTNDSDGLRGCYATPCRLTVRNSNPLREIHMPDSEEQASERATLRRMALSRWENEGGAESGPMDGASAGVQAQADIPPLTNAELVQLRVRVIALENLAVALLTERPARQIDLLREMAAYICPRPGFTPHRLTIHAAAEMISLVERAGHFKTPGPSQAK